MLFRFFVRPPAVYARIASRAGQFGKHASRLGRDVSANVAITFALALVPIMAVVGAAVDYSRASAARTAMQSALDSVALNLSKEAANLSSAQLSQKAEAYFLANFSRSDVRNIKITATVQAGDQPSLTVSGTGTVDNAIMGILGSLMTDIGGSSTARWGGKNLEIALALDTTGSMAGSKILDLQAAAKDLVDTVVSDSQSPFYSKVAIAPYSMGVNVGSYASQLRGSYNAGTCTNPGCEYFKFKNPYNTWKTFKVSTCVTERTGAKAYTDDAPSSAPLGWNYPSDSNPCLSNQIVPLSNDKTALRQQIRQLDAGGSTAGHVGIAWAWYLLSPNFGYLWPSANRPASYSTPNVLKVAVIMTDGEYNSAYCNGVISQDSTSGSGATSDHINCDAPNGSSFDQANKMCAAMKRAGITVYTVGFQIVNDPRARDLMANCATSSAYAYIASSGAELKAAFHDIAAKVSALRIAK